MLADLPAGSCCEPNQGPNPAENNPEGVEVAFPPAELTENTCKPRASGCCFRAIWTDLNSCCHSSTWPESTPLPWAGRHNWDLQPAPEDGWTDCKSSKVNQLCKERLASWQIRSACHQMNAGKRWSLTEQLKAPQQVQAAETLSVATVCTKMGGWDPNVINTS